MKIAITGKKGSGKSFILSEFEKLGIPSIKIDNDISILDNFYEKHKLSPYVLVECTYLFEYKLETYFDNVLYIYTDTELRNRNNIKKNLKNINTNIIELPDEYKTVKSDWVMVNNYTNIILNDINLLHNYLIS